MTNFQKQFLPLCMLVLLTQNLFGQEEVKSKSQYTNENLNSITIDKKNSEVQNKEVNTAQQYPITISKKPGQDQVVHDEAFLNNELERIDMHVRAIDQKMAIVNQDPEKKSKAESEGWFYDMDITKQSLLSRRLEILEALKAFEKN